MVAIQTSKNLVFVDETALGPPQNEGRHVLPYACHWWDVTRPGSDLQ